MRITHGMKWNATIDQISNAQSRHQELTERIATQKKVNRASDDPNAAMKIIGIRRAINENENCLKSISDGDGWISMTESALAAAYDLLGQARKAAATQATGTLSDHERQILSQNLQSLCDQLVAVANTTYADRFLFSGSARGGAPFSAQAEEARISAAGTSPDNVFAGEASSSGLYSGSTNRTFVLRITQGGSLDVATGELSTDGGRTWTTRTEDGIDLSQPGAMAGGTLRIGDGVVLTLDDRGGTAGLGQDDLFTVGAIGAGHYRGNDERLTATIGQGMQTACSITGAEAFTASGEAGVDLFGTLGELRDAIARNDTGAVSAQLERLGRAQEQILLKQAQCGTVANQLQTAQTGLKALNDRLASLLAEYRDVDLAEYAVRLSEQEVALNASYSLAAKISGMTILNFLK